MELPIQLKFFRKLELYQQLKTENRRSVKAGSTRKELWNMEKEVLSWTEENHHHRMSALKNTDIQNIVEKKFEKKYLDNELAQIPMNLVSRGFAAYKNQNGDESHGIVIVPEGFLMGEVINDIEGTNYWSKFKYWIFYKFVWGTALAGALIVIFKFFEMIVGYGKRLF